MQIANYEIEHLLTSSSRSDGMIVGLDEVGRGSLAGPLVVGAVCLYYDNVLQSDIGSKLVIADSKSISETKRKKTHDYVKNFVYGSYCAQASVEEIDRLGITLATSLAFDRAVSGLQKVTNTRVKILLIDGNQALANGIKARCEKRTFTKGDAKILSIAASSVIAKVTRDELMIELSKQEKYAKYAWHKNKGYGTNEHIKAIQRSGLSDLHRKQFVRKIVAV